MRSILSAVCWLTMAVALPNLHAAVVVLNITGTLTDGSPISGTVTIDNTAGLATAVNVVVGAPTSLTFNLVDAQAQIGPTIYQIQAGLAAPLPDFNITLPVASLVGYTGGTLCSSSAGCGFISNVFFSAAQQTNVQSASLSTPRGTTLTKAFGEPTVSLNETTTLRFTVTNPNPFALTGVAFTDVLPLGLEVATPNGLTGSCGTGTITATPGSGSISLANGTLAANASCTFTIDVRGIALGVQSNITSPVTSNQAPAGPAATAAITVIGDPYKVNYFSNLNVGDSFLNITNTGALGAGLRAGTEASVTGSICANVYVFSPDEQMISCCSCPVTPNGLRSLSVREDLINNTLTPALPTSVVVKLLASVPVAGSCNNSAGGVITAQLSPGLSAWGTTLHARPPGGSPFQQTERAFVPATLSQGELTRLGSICDFILANGSGFGICRSCRLGGLGGAKN